MNEAACTGLLLHAGLPACLHTWLIEEAQVKRGEATVASRW